MNAVDGGPWMGPTTAEWVERIARGSTPVREYVDGEFRSWILRASTEDFPALPAAPFVGGGQVESSVDSLRGGSSESGGSL